MLLSFSYWRFHRINFVKINKFQMIKDENLSLDNLQSTSDYSRALTHYSKYHIKVVIPFLSTIAKSSPYASYFPVFKLLKAISKIFLIG